MTTVLIDGVEYVPKLEIPPITDVGLQNCLESLTEIIYFAECSHKHRSWAWDALNALSPDLAKLSSDNPMLAFETVRSFIKQGS